MSSGGPPRWKLPARLGVALGSVASVAQLVGAVVSGFRIIPWSVGVTVAGVGVAIGAEGLWRSGRLTRERLLPVLVGVLVLVVGAAGSTLGRVPAPVPADPKPGGRGMTGSDGSAQTGGRGSAGPDAPGQTAGAGTPGPDAATRIPDGRSVLNTVEPQGAPVFADPAPAPPPAGCGRRFPAAHPSSWSAGPRTGPAGMTSPRCTGRPPALRTARRLLQR